MSPRRVLQICDLLQRGPLPAFIMISARGDDLIANPRIIPAVVAARILRVTVGVETTEPSIASKVGKSISHEVYRKVFERMREHDIFSVASLIVGLPGESSEMRKRAVELTVDIQSDSAHFLPFLPLPGTPLSQDHNGFDANPDDIHDAHQFTELFFQHPAIQKNLAAAAERTEIRGRLARAALARFTTPDLAPNLLSL